MPYPHFRHRRVAFFNPLNPAAGHARARERGVQGSVIVSGGKPGGTVNFTVSGRPAFNRIIERWPRDCAVATLRQAGDGEVDTVVMHFASGGEAHSAAVVETSIGSTSPSAT